MVLPLCDETALQLMIISHLNFFICCLRVFAQFVYCRGITSGALNHIGVLSVSYELNTNSRLLSSSKESHVLRLLVNQ